MKRSMMFYLALPCLTLPLALAGCPGEPSGETTNGDDETEGISSFGTAGDGDGDQSGDGDGEGDGDGDPGDGDGGMDMPSCGEVSIVPTYIPPNVMLVVDASGSMVFEPNNWDHDLDSNTNEVTRWFSLHGVVDTVMSNFGPAMYSGLQRFPSAAACDPHPCYNLASCTTETTPEVDIALDNGAAILAALPGPNATSEEIEGGTPATKGIVSAVNHLLMQPEELPDYILLITDGAANCNTDLEYPDYIEAYDENLPLTVESAYDMGITTFVVGIDIINMLVGAGVDGAPGANPYERLNDVALAGHAPKNGGADPEKFFNATNQTELLDAIQEILGEVTDCKIDLTMAEGGAPPEAQVPFVTFTSDGMMVPGPLDDCASGDGWAWIDVGLVMTFCGTYCDDFKKGTATFDGTYGCPPPG
jgi:von Willebrand factor type A domain